MRIFRELLFLEGYSTRPQDLVEGERCDDAALAPGEVRDAAPRTPWRTLWLLGGRPMHAGHNFDQEEPFEGYAACRDRANMSVTCDAKRGAPAPRFSAPH